MKISIIIPPLFSIISLQKIIGSISRQSYPHFELIVFGESGLELDHLTVGDRAIDSKILIINNPSDDINSIFHAFLKSSGEIVWIIDCLDEFHPDKLRLHVETFSENAAIGAIRSGFVLTGVENQFHSLSTSDPVLNAAGLFEDGPVYFSDVIVRRAWVEKFFANEIPPDCCSPSSLSLSFYIHLVMAGCYMVGSNQAINVRYQVVDEELDIKKSAESVIRCLEHLFTSPMAEPSYIKWRDVAVAQTYLFWSIKAFEDEKTAVGQSLFKSSILLNRSILDVGARGYFKSLIDYALKEGRVLDKFVKKNIHQLSPEFLWMSQFSNEAIARGYFYKAVEDIAFGRYECADKNIVHSDAYGLNLMQSDLMDAVAILSDHSLVYGFDTVRLSIEKLPQLGKYIYLNKINWIMSTWYVNHAFTQFKKRDFSAVAKLVVKAVLATPAYIKNPGVGSMLIRSILQIVKGYFQPAKQTSQMMEIKKLS